MGGDTEESLRLESEQYDQVSSSDFDRQGKLNRKVWLQEQRNSKLVGEIEGMRKEYQEEMQVEIMTASGLRDRIGKLEQKLRKGKQELADWEVVQRRLSRELESARTHFAAEEGRLKTEWTDMKEALAKEKKGVTILRGEVTALTGDRQAALEELKRLRDTKQAVLIRSPGPVLQARSPNIINPRMRSSSPATPTKCSPSCASQNSLSGKDTVRSDCNRTPKKSLAQRHGQLEDSHYMLKAEYDKLRTKYSEDLKHWKEWKAKEMARIERKKQTREVRRNAKTAASDSTAEALDSSQIKLVSASDESQPNEAVASPDRDVQRSSPTVEGCIHEAQEREFDEDEDMTHCIDSGKPLADRPGAFQNAYGRTNPTEQDTTPRSKAFISAVEINLKERSTDTPLPHILNPLHPTHSEDRRRIAQASRVTPWLGAPVISPDDNRHGHTALKADEMFGTPDDLDKPSYLPVTNASAKTPLVRDRLGPMMSVSSVRKQTPRRTLETDANDRERASPTSSSSRSRASRKRLLDLENLSPAERVIRLKQLSKMPTAAKRDYYADYKGRGRYVPPEAVRPQVFDEFEIDPRQNEGASYQFHDVKRRKLERKQMHGGDCECCKDYYQAVGPLPRYNQGPKWKDPSQVQETENGDFMNVMQEHQDKVSRHRETWRKPPTPPGFWQIGFPTTQDVVQQNAVADQMMVERGAQVRREAAEKDSKWRKKQ